MANLSKFQIIFFGSLIVIALIGVIVFSLSRSSNNAPAHLTMWGSVPANQISNLIQQIKEKNNQTLNITYLQKSPTDLDTGLAEAIADGQSPDLILLPQTLIIKQQNKIIPIPYQTYSERTFKDTFIQEGELFLGSNGVLGLPFQIDPMVMYWNRDMYSAASLSEPPASWVELPNLVSKLTKTDNSQNVLKSAVALGEYSNITNAKDIISTLLLQAGTPITSYDSTGALASSLTYKQSDQATAPAPSAINFYTQFSNPALPVYSWNRSLRTSLDAFTAEDLATYFGFASEYNEIKAKNPNLNFDVALMPQISGADTKVTFGDILGLSVVRGSLNANAAYAAALVLTSAPTMAIWDSMTHLPPVRRDLLATKPGDDVLNIFYSSALWAKGWLDPDAAGTSAIFKEMVESISSGQAKVDEAVYTANDELNSLISKH